ncbi:hypothetical protein PRIPAC_87650 [Pristionchus pacificus]|uniref:Uncharacterized protein n=1 Tax=Pristionchus pacificus TaxID=54126 RepID=A0A2A6CY20_PRIPA|nr:hypothetical protein PRIPAC_87650 [Pristionchus pacificus]|eukprot:PDM83028.1 hypothetical protein PRIPAC_37421 [Pristionchus pacificus]
MQRRKRIVYIWTFLAHALNFFLFAVARQLENSREDYRKHTFKWWPAVMGAYNVSLSGSYTTFLPPIVLTKSISPSDPSLSFLPTIDESSTEKVDISYRVSWLEKQIVLYLALCSITVFVMVGGFLLYIFFWDEWQKKFRSLANLRSPIAACTIVNPTLIASATVDGRLILWPTASSRQPDSINRLRPEDAHSHQPPHLRPRRSARHIWALSSRHSCLLVGCADGCMEIASCEEMRLLATLHTSKSSITNIVNRGPLLVIARVDGTVEFASLELTAETPSTLHALTSLRLIRCCREPLAFLLSAPLCFIAVGVDSMIKAYDSRTTECLFSLLAHNAPLSSIKIDHVENMAFSVCESAVLCAWNLTGVLAWSTDCVTNVELAITSSFLVTFSPDGRIVLREKKLGKKQSELSNQRQTKVASKMTIRVITGDLVVVSLDETIVFWDLQKQAILGEIDMEFTVDGLHIINESTILVQSTQTLVIVEVCKILLALSSD